MRKEEAVKKDAERVALGNRPARTGLVPHTLRDLHPEAAYRATFGFYDRWAALDAARERFGLTSYCDHRVIMWGFAGGSRNGRIRIELPNLPVFTINGTIADDGSVSGVAPGEAENMLNFYARDGAQVALWAEWRRTKTIYRFDEAFSTELDHTDQESLASIPPDVLRYAPQRAVMFTLPREYTIGRLDVSVYNAVIAGVIDDVEQPYLAMTFFNLAEPERAPQAYASLSALSQDRFFFHLTSYHDPGEAYEDPERQGHEMTRAAIQRYLYLCSPQPDFDGTIPEPSSPVKTKRGVRFFPASEPTEINVGIRLGALFQKSRGQREHEATGSGRHQRFHYRGAHWQRYRIGSRSAQEPHYRVRWKHGYFVNVDDRGDEITVRPVK